MLLMDLIVTLKMIVEARLNPAAIYPIDYEGVRAKPVALLEQALGKALVPRDIFDNMLKRAVKMHDDLMLDSCWKMEREKAQYAAIKDEAERASLDRALTAALSAEAKGFIVHRRCRACRRLIAAFPAGTECNITVCSFCGSTNP